MESADKNDEQMNNEQPGPSQSSLPLETVDDASLSQDTSLSQDSGDKPSSTLNLYAALGLSPEDVVALAQIPESEISIETLPHLIMQLKAKQAQCGGQTVTSPPKEELPNDQEADSTDGLPQKSTSKNESPEQLGHVRSRREPRHYKSSNEGSPPKFPMSYQTDDFRGVLPRSFPHTCSLCHCILYSAATWNDHLNGSRHEESRRKLLRTHPDWHPHDTPGRGLDSHSGGDALPVRRDSRSSSSRRRPYPTDSGPGEQHFPPSDRILHLKPKAGTKVVVTKFPQGTVGVQDLLSLAKPFGTVVKHLIFPCKGFLEFSSNKEAVNMVSHYATKPPYVKDNKLALYLSPMVASIHTPRLDKAEKRPKRSSHGAVCFSHLPSDKESEPELLEVAKMFGEVRYSKVYKNEVVIEMEDWYDAEVMVKYYHTNPLKIFGKNIRVSLSPFHKKLRLSPDPSRKGDSSRSSSSLPKSKEASRSSHVKSKEESSLQKDLTEEKYDDVGDERAVEEHEHMDVSLDSGAEDEQGMKVEDDQVNSEEDLGQGDAVDEQILKEPLVETNANANAKGSEGLDVEMDQNLEEITVEEKPPMNSQENPDEASTSPGPAEEPKSVDNPEEMEEMEEKKDVTEDNENDEDDMDFPDNMDDFVTLDELDDDADAGEKEDSEETSKVETDMLVSPCPILSTKGGKVVAVWRIRKGYGLEDALVKLAEPFGRVTNHAISFYRQEALLELESNEAADRMVKFYRGSKKATIFGRHVSVSMCLTLQQLEGPSGRSIYIGMLPLQKYSDISLLRLAQPFGKISAYHLNWRHRKCFIQMESAEAAEKMVEKYLEQPPKFYGSVLRICLCRKGDSQIPWQLPVKYELWCEQQKTRKTLKDKAKVEAEAQAENGQSAESPAAKKSATDDGAQSTVSDSEGAVSGSDRTDGQNKEEEVEQRSDEVPVPLGPYKPNNPVGIDYIVQRTGFFCKLCKVFYTNEKTAKSLHCSSLAHYQKLKMTLAEDHPNE
ncbi:matrin-3-like isoform X1 [Conger conger]|uniref:matrin-3-like isoform X1 n=1 Tax=Conger conger TaxID=82655 RepID=UPI002A59F6D9|nr:matrin-3-like isoform X1 [Conger conger]XP_061106018.1 matrin-3-like isoform X1 [Conger conger]